MKQETIDKLLVLANTAFEAQESADKYARNAAYEAARAAAFRHNPECADTAVQMAVIAFNMNVSDLTIYSAQAADAWNDRFTSDRSYQAIRESFSDHVLPFTRVSQSAFFPIAQPANDAVHTCKDKMESLYLTSFSHDSETKDNAKKAALYVYKHTWCVARAAYVVSMFNITKTHDPINREKVFKNTMTARLNQDLKYDQIEPDILLKIMCSIPIQAIAGLMILGGIIAIVCCTWGIAALPFVPTIAIASTAAGIGTGILVGSFFARKEQQKIADENELREEMNTIY